MPSLHSPDKAHLLYKLIKVGIGNQLNENIKNIYSICNNNVNVNWFTTNDMQANPDKYQAVVFGKRKSGFHRL